MTRRIMIVVTHLLGSGHLSRALTLGRAFAKNGHVVHVVSGGFPAPHLDTEGILFHQLPPLCSDGTDFSRLLTPNREIASEAYYETRKEMLSTSFLEIQPHLLMTELFPFGRRNLKAEFLSLLEMVSEKTKVLCSVRDILAPPSKPRKVQFAKDTIAQYYDLVLCHSDPGVIRLDQSWPVDSQLSNKLQYTGFVAAPSPTVTANKERSGIIVSAGGGAVGGALFSTAIAAAKRSEDHWRLLVAGRNLDKHIHDLKHIAPPNVTVEAARSDYRELLAMAKASVNMCGYNTAMDVLQTGVASVMVPFDDGGEVEQGIRAKALAGLDGITRLSLADLTAQSLLSALADVVSQPPRNVTAFRFDGANETVRICMDLIDS